MSVPATSSRKPLRTPRIAVSSKPPGLTEGQRAELTPVKVAVTEWLPGDICELDGFDGVSTSGATKTPTKSLPEATILALPTICVSTLKMTESAALLQLLPPTALVIFAVNLTVSLYCCVVGATVSVEVVSAGFTFMVNEQLEVLPQASVAV